MSLVPISYSHKPVPPVKCALIQKVVVCFYHHISLRGCGTNQWGSGWKTTYTTHWTTATPKPPLCTRFFLCSRICCATWKPSVLLLCLHLLGALSEDPEYPKIQWPSPEMCSACHAVKENGEHKWNKEKVLSFLSSYFSSSRILTGTV